MTTKYKQPRMKIVTQVTTVPVNKTHRPLTATISIEKGCIQVNPKVSTGVEKVAEIMLNNSMMYMTVLVLRPL